MPLACGIFRSLNLTSDSDVTLRKVALRIWNWSAGDIRRKGVRIDGAFSLTAPFFSTSCKNLPRIHDPNHVMPELSAICHPNGSSVVVVSIKKDSWIKRTIIWFSGKFRKKKVESIGIQPATPSCRGEMIQRKST